MNKISIDGGPWTPAGKTSNQVYVIRQDEIPQPQPPAQPVEGPLFHTLVHLSSKNAKGLTDTAAITEAIWSEYTDRVVEQQNPRGGVWRPLKYYGNWRTTATHTDQWLGSVDGSGNCGAWAKSFIEMLRIQGIENPDDYWQVKTSDGSDFLVNDWAFISDSGDNAAYPFLSVLKDNIGFSRSEFEFLFSDVIDSPGLPGQSNPNPRSAFANHQIVKIGDWFYDPSYGLKYSSLASFEENSVAGYYIATSKPMQEWWLGIDLNRGACLAVDAVHIIPAAWMPTTPARMFPPAPAASNVIDVSPGWKQGSNNSNNAWKN